MKNKIGSFTGLFSLGTLAIFAVGCATGPTTDVKIDKAAQVRSRVYTDSVTVMAASDRASRGGVCAVPHVAEKKVLPAGAKDQASTVWRDLVGRANTCVSEKNWSVLESLATEMAKADIDSPWAAYFLSVAAEAKQDYSRAMWMSELAQKKAGGSIGLFVYQHGHIWLRMGQPAKAVADFQKAVTLEPRLFDGQLFLAQIYARDMEPDKAIGYYRAALKLNEKSYAALTGLAELMIGKGSSAEAAQLYSQASSVDSSQLQPWLRLAYIYENLQKNPELALNTYKALKSRVESGKIHDRVELDYNSRIKAIEESLKPRQPAQASAKSSDKADEKRRVK